MKKAILFIAVLVLLLGVPAAVKAKPPEELGPLTTVEYVNNKLVLVWDAIEELYEMVEVEAGPIWSAINDLIDRVTALEEGGGGGVDFDVPEIWGGYIIEDEYDEVYLYSLGCFWEETKIVSPSVRARAIAQLDTGEKIYGTGTCDGIYFGEFVPGTFPTIERVDFWFNWMGKEKHAKQDGIIPF